MTSENIILFVDIKMDLTYTELNYVDILSAEY